MNTYCVDVANEYQKSKSKLFRNSLLFSIIFTIVLISDVLLVVLSNEDYIINLIIAIIITILFIWYAIYFISNVYRDLDAEYRFYKGYESGLHPTDEVLFIKGSDEMVYINGVYAYPMLVRFVSNLEEKDKIIYSMNKDLGLEASDKLTTVTYQRILIKMEKHS